MRAVRFMMPFLLLGCFLGCNGGGGDNNYYPPAPKGNLTIRLGSDSFPGYDSVVVSLEKMEGSTDGASWTSLGDIKQTVDLMKLQNGHSVIALPLTSLSPATYTQFRITWATVNYQSAIMQPAYVILNGGSQQLLSMPSTTIVKGSVTITADGSTQALIMLDGQQAVQNHAFVYVFQATGWAMDVASCARITGHLGDGNTNLSGVEVYAETLDGLGVATIRRRAFTDVSGNYVLEGLPTGSLYFVTAQPAGTLSAYAAKAAAPVNATTATTFTADLAFSSPSSPGSLTLNITTSASTATQGTWGELRQPLTTGSSSQILIVRSQTVASGLAQDQALFPGLAPGAYGVTAQRSTAGAAPTMFVGSQWSVSSGATTMANIP